MDRRRARGGAVAARRGRACLNRLDPGDGVAVPAWARRLGGVALVERVGSAVLGATLKAVAGRMLVRCTRAFCASVSLDTPRGCKDALGALGRGTRSARPGQGARLGRCGSGGGSRAAAACRRRLGCL
jgi:hypothetical protein